MISCEIREQAYVTLYNTYTTLCNTYNSNTRRTWRKAA